MLSEIEYFEWLDAFSFLLIVLCLYVRRMTVISFAHPFLDLLSKHSPGTNNQYNTSMP